MDPNKNQKKNSQKNYSLLSVREIDLDPQQDLQEWKKKRYLSEFRE